MDQSDRRAMGLRERKKIKTRATIQQHALRLFREQGYDATTVEQIAEAAEISPSTFFRYFPTKEDVVLNDEYDALILDAFHAQPKDVSPIQALRNALRAVYDKTASDELETELERGKLIMQVPELRSAMMNNMVHMLQMLADEVAKRVGRPPNDFAVRTFSGALVGLSFSVFLHCAEHPEVDFVSAFDEGLSLLEAGCFQLEES